MPTQRRLMALARILKPFMGKTAFANFQLEFLGQNLVYQDTIKKDPLHYRGKMRLSTAIEMANAGKAVLNNPSKLKTPFMLYHGTADQIVLLHHHKLGMSMESGEVLS